MSGKLGTDASRRRLYTVCTAHLEVHDGGVREDTEVVLQGSALHTQALLTCLYIVELLLRDAA